MTDPNERNRKVIIYSMIEEGLVNYCGFVYNGVIWLIYNAGIPVAKPKWTETDADRFCESENEVLDRAKRTLYQAIRTNLVLDDAIKTAIVEAHSYDFLKRNPNVLNEEERRRLDRRIL